MRVPAALEPRWLLVVGAPPAEGTTPFRAGLREALRAGMAARWTAPEPEPNDSGFDGRGTAPEER
ncbi:MAG TPA: hypothetical protein VM759_10730 [Longimicrobium sp.]|nr:hypothetical protein [Longimicrobium sp.]